MNCIFTFGKESFSGNSVPNSMDTLHVWTLSEKQLRIIAPGHLATGEEMENGFGIDFSLPAHKSQSHKATRHQAQVTYISGAFLRVARLIPTLILKTVAFLDVPDVFLLWSF